MDNKEKYMRTAKAQDKAFYEAARVSWFWYVIIAVIFVLLLTVVPHCTTVEKEVMTAEVITVQEKYISSDNYILVLTDGEDTFNLRVTPQIYDSYIPGDTYLHDADRKQYTPKEGSKTDGKD